MWLKQFQNLKLKKIGLLGVPSYAVEKFKAAIFAKDVVVNSFHFEISQGEGKLIEGIGIIEIQGDKAKFAYLESTNTGNLIPQEIIIKYPTDKPNGDLVGDFKEYFP